MKQKIKEKLEELSFKGFILYIFDLKHLEAKLKGLPKLASHVTIAETQERVQLDKPAFYLEGKPVWVCIRNFPLSVELEEINLEGEIKKLPFRLPTAAEIESKVKSLYAKLVFGKKLVDSSYYLISLLLCALTGLIVHLLDRIYLIQQNPIVNSTVGG